LEIQNFGNTMARKDMVASFDAFGETKPQ